MKAVWPLQATKPETKGVTQKNKRTGCRRNTFGEQRILFPDMKKPPHDQGDFNEEVLPLTQLSS
jgi:hypothetical protein